MCGALLFRSAGAWVCQRGTIMSNRLAQYVAMLPEPRAATRWTVRSLLARVSQEYWIPDVRSRPQHCSARLREDPPSGGGRDSRLQGDRTEGCFLSGLGDQPCPPHSRLGRVQRRVRPKPGCWLGTGLKACVDADAAKVTKKLTREGGVTGRFRMRGPLRSPLGTKCGDGRRWGPTMPGCA